MEHSPSEKLTVPEVIKKLPTLLGNRKLITMFIRAPHLSLFSYLHPGQFSPHLPTYFCKISFNIILQSTPRPFGDLFPSGFSTKTLIHATFPAHLILRDLLTLLIFGQEYES
jgi:hypothetical protein